MKFLKTTVVKVKDKEHAIEGTLNPVTNAVRYKLLDAGTDESFAGRIAMAEFVFDNCFASLTVKGKAITPSDMKKADITDEDTATIYFSCVNVAVEAVLAAAEIDEKK